MSSLLKISEAASLALHSLGLMAAQPEATLSTREAALSLGVSEAHLAKVFQRLARAGLLTSQRGPHGGFILAKPPTQITLLEAYEAADGPLQSRSCLLDRPVCQGQCILGGLLTSVDRQVREHFSATTLADLAGAFSAVPRRAAN